MGVRRPAKLFGMPNSTIRDIIKRVPARDPGVRDAARRFQLVRPVDMSKMPGRANINLLDNLLHGGDYPDLSSPRPNKRPAA